MAISNPIGRILVMLPSKGRPRQCAEAIRSWEETQSGFSDLIVSIPTKWWEEYERVPTVRYQLDVFDDGMAKPCNAMFFSNPNYAYYMFMGDDIRFRTKAWDGLFVAAFGAIEGSGVVYGDDLFQRETICTHWCASGDIVRALGFFCIPVCRHLSHDRFWMALGQRLNRLHYLPNVVTEHLHYICGKGPYDWVYEDTNNVDAFSCDKRRYRMYMSNFFEDDYDRVKSKLRL